MKDTEFHIAKCKQCIQFKGKPQIAEMENIQAIYPLQSLHLDYLTIEMTQGGKDIHVLIITVHYCTIHRQIKNVKGLIVH